MADRNVIVSLRGTPPTEERPRLRDFIAQLDAIGGALSHLEEHIAEPDYIPMQYRVGDMNRQSLRAIIEAIPKPQSTDISALVIHRFISGIKNIKEGIVPEDFDFDLLQTFRRIGSPNHTRKSAFEVILETDSEKVEIEKSLEPDIEKILGPDEIVHGSVSGMLEQINIHAHANIFRIYPIIGPKKIECYFKRDKLNKIISGINRYVNVHGELRYKRRDKFPYAINMGDIEVYPEEKDLPSIFDLRGIAPKATGDIKSEEFVKRLRDATW